MRSFPDVLEAKVVQVRRPGIIDKFLLPSSLMNLYENWASANFLFMGNFVAFAWGLVKSS
jgi:hypothetical protein